MGGMNLAELFFNYTDCRRELIDGINNLTDEQLDWTPPNHDNSIRKLLVHIAEAEYWWIESVAQGRIDEHDESFDQKHYTLPELLGLLDQWHDKTVDFMRRHDIAQFDSVTFHLPWRKTDVTLGWLVWHVVEHQARHRGQIFMLLRMQGLDVPRV